MLFVWRLNECPMVDDYILPRSMKHSLYKYQNRDFHTCNQSILILIPQKVRRKVSETEKFDVELCFMLTDDFYKAISSHKWQLFDQVRSNHYSDFRELDLFIFNT